MAVGMILACLAFAVAALVEIKINVSSVTAQLLLCSIYFPYMFNLDSLGPTTGSFHGTVMVNTNEETRQHSEGHFPPE